MKIRKLLSLLLSAALAAGLVAGCHGTSTVTGADDGEHITIDGQSYSTSLEELRLINLGLNDQEIKPLDQMTKLTLLNLTSNHITDLTPLSGLVGLTSLTLDRNMNLKDLAPLAGLTNLTTLDLKDCAIRDLTPLSGLINLTTLYLDMNEVSDLSPLASLTNLETLGLAANQITDLAPLSALTNLASLSLGANDIIDLSPLSSLTNLVDLSFGDGNLLITDWSPVAHVPNIVPEPEGLVADLRPAASEGEVSLVVARQNILSTGQTFYIAIKEDQSAEYRWECKVTDDSIIRLISDELNTDGFPSTLPYETEGDMRIFHFEAMHPGSSEILLKYVLTGSDNVRTSMTFLVVIED